ncbi:choice-of-anchor D domain-containing protein [Humisphaera borealis]|nr:choice-of-anchor D domain-containing protein [Humisphaera borealis]
MFNRNASHAAKSFRQRSSRRPVASAVRAIIEQVECRQLFAALVINGTGNADTIVLNSSSFTLNGVTTSIAATTTSIQINGNAGADTITVAGVGSARTSVTVNGNAGTDSITIGTGNLDGVQKDVLVSGGALSDNDLLTVNDSARPVTGSDDPNSRVRVSSIEINNRAINFANVARVVVQQSGNPNFTNVNEVEAGVSVTLNGNGGNDFYEVGDNDLNPTGGVLDNIRGRLTLNAGANSGGIGDSFSFNNFLASSPSSFVMSNTQVTSPSSSAFRIDYSGFEGTSINLSAEAERFDASTRTTAADWLLGGGADVIFGTAAADTLTNDGTDPVEFHGGGGNDTLIGGDSADILFGDEGSDLLDGGFGDDRYGFANALASQVDTISDIDGINELDFSSMSQAVTVDLGSTVLATHTNRTVIAAPGTLMSNAFGGSGNDTIFGNGDANRLVGNGGSDNVSGLGGDDEIIGTSVQSSVGDLLFGGDGDDTLTTAGSLSKLFGGPGTDGLLGPGSGLFPNADPEIFVESDGGTVDDGSTVPEVANFTDFGTIAPGGSVSKTFTVFNDGDAPLITASLRVTDAAGSVTNRFSVTEGLSGVIQPGQWDSFTITFSTTVVGVADRFVHFSDNDSTEAPFDFAIRGTVQNGSPEVEVRGNNIVIADGDATASTTDFTDFGSVNTGVPLTRTFTVKNTGTAALSTSGLTVPAGFSIDSTDTLLASIPAGGSDTFKVKLNATAAGTFAGNLSFANNDSNENPYNFSIKGIVNAVAGGAPEVEVRGNNIVILDGDTTASTTDFTDFGSVNVGLPVTRTFTVKNTGTKALTTSGVTVPAGFVIDATDTLLASIPAGGQDTFKVKFSATSGGTFTGNISFANNDSNENPYNFAIKGIAKGPEIEVRGNNVVINDGDTLPSTTDFTDFGSAAKNISITRSFTVRNTGTVALTLSSLKFATIAGTASTAPFSLSGSFPTSVAAGGSATFSIKFLSLTAGTFDRMLSFTTNDASEGTFNFILRGKAV